MAESSSENKIDPNRFEVLLKYERLAFEQVKAILALVSVEKDEAAQALLDRNHTTKDPKSSR